MQVTNRASSRTRNKILKTSIELFNCQGVQNVSLESIAVRMGISRSNLTYHFKRKQDLLRATLVVLEEQLREVLALPARAIVPEEGAQYMMRILHALWDFRYFFNGLTHLLTSDSVLRTQYFHFETWVIDSLDQRLQDMIRLGDCQPPRAPNTTRLLAENIWSQWRGWLHMQHIDSPDALKPEGQAFFDCALHNWSLMEPYFSGPYARELLAVYRGLMLGEVSPGD
ncbi:TetR/AcrR family transcriptional regulator [Pseudomonas umsongensis]|uniref:TetR/AcrR family transcriptional regulator n=1 Tax=Pseudomonas umsongensis TaxID=198618 RepID=UPI00200B2AFF|nr:TetR/AcrR family transcriptional regulator [Pseudomonas umsongensis]MCK8683295.1 TetR/AcrR family transcriptional regulator [Pseudomonas umsongensis]